MLLNKLHRLNAIALSVFLLAHLCNHVMILYGINMHIEVMSFLRNVYRKELIEYILVTLFIFQIVLGISLIFKRKRSREIWAYAQLISGVYLAFFLIQHLFAVFFVRSSFPNLDTNAFWAASVVSRTPFVWYFAPYYSLAIFALFIHVASAWKFISGTSSKGPAILACLGLPIGVIIVAGFMGVFSPIVLPPAYIDYLRYYWAS